jgi:hypothetical protein
MGVNMTALTKEILRWIAIVLFGGFGLWVLLYSGYGVVVQSRGGWLERLLLLGILAAFAVPPLAIAYYCCCRQYRRIFIILGILSAIAVYVELMILPGQLGVHEFVARRIHNGEHEWAFVGLPISLLFLFGPIYAAAWFYRLCHRLAYTPGEEQVPRTRATGWLVWLGVFCIVLPLLAMLLFFSLGISPTTPSSVDSVHRWIVLGTGLSLLGALVAFLGLVIRRPVVQSDMTVHN